MAFEPDAPTLTSAFALLLARGIARLETDILKTLRLRLR
jgi:hypothetical protein